jgi:transcription termination factor NusB
MTDEPAVKLQNLKRRRARERANATRFSALLDGFDDSTSLDDFEHYRGRLQETLERLISLDDAIHDLLSDNEYKEDIKACEEYIDKTKRAIQKASRHMDNVLSASTALLNIQGSTQPITTIPTVPVTHSVKLPAIKLEPFAGNVENWSRFWEQFRSSIDEDASLSPINKHVFLRGYLEGEPKCWWTE